MKTVKLDISDELYEELEYAAHSMKLTLQEAGEMGVKLVIDANSSMNRVKVPRLNKTVDAILGKKSNVISIQDAYGN